MMYSKIANEWDSIAYERYIAFRDKADSSYENILKPNIIKVIMENDISRVLDVGCGVGALTFEASKISQYVTGIDISSVSIELAKRFYTSSNIHYKLLNIEDLNAADKFSIVYSNMVLMNVPDIQPVINSIFDCMKPGAIFVFTITHPSFWPIYWDYYSNQNFKYKSEYEYMGDFKIQNKIYGGKLTRHFHRPIEYYLSTLIKSGFTLRNLYELKDEVDKFWYPKFMMIEVEKSLLKR